MKNVKLKMEEYRAGSSIIIPIMVVYGIVLIIVLANRGLGVGGRIVDFLQNYNIPAFVAYVAIIFCVIAITRIVFGKLLDIDIVYRRKRFRKYLSKIQEMYHEFAELRDDIGWTLLHTAAYIGDIDSTKLIIASKADANAEEQFNNSPLNFAAGKGYIDIVDVLLKRGADVNHKNEDGWTPLHGAASSGHFSIVELLINNGALVNLRDSDGRTPLNHSKHYRKTRVSELLIKHGALL